MRAVRLLGAALLVAALAVTGPAAQASAGPPPVKMRVATYNIAAGAGVGGFDLDRTAAAIRETRADVVGLQEVDVHWSARSEWRDTATELARRLHMWVRFAPIYSLDPLTPGEPRREYGVAVLSRFPIVAFENHDITRLSTQDPNPVPEPAPGFGEAVVRARGALLHVYVTHLDYRPDPSVRAVQAQETVEIMGEDGRRASQLLLGDLNAEASAPELAPLWTRLVDGYGSVGAPPGLTYPATEPVKRIDFVCGANVGVHRAVVPDSALVTQASDHRPVYADITVPRERH